MPCGRGYDDGPDVVAVDELTVIGPVEQEQESMLRVAEGDPFQILMRKPADPLKLFLKQQTCIYSDDHKPGGKGQGNIQTKIEFVI